MTNNRGSRVIYTSSYDRGLEHLLKIWPEVKKEAPEATLDIYYGWELFDIRAKDNPSLQRWKEKMLEMMTANGVTEHGRIPQAQVAEEMKKSAIWAYPTHFGEINCITGLKAQAYGAVPVVINYAALETTVQFGIKVNGDIFDPEVRDVFKDQLVWVLKNPKWQEEVRKPMTEWASKKFTWAEIAKHWNKSFTGDDSNFWVQAPVNGQTDKINGISKIVDGYTGEVTSRLSALYYNKGGDK